MINIVNYPERTRENYSRLHQKPRVKSVPREIIFLILEKTPFTADLQLSMVSKSWKNLFGEIGTQRFLMSKWICLPANNSDLESHIPDSQFQILFPALKRRMQLAEPKYGVIAKRAYSCRYDSKNIYDNTADVSAQFEIKDNLLCWSGHNHKFFYNLETRSSTKEYHPVQIATSLLPVIPKDLWIPCGDQKMVIERRIRPFAFGEDYGKISKSSDYTGTFLWMEKGKDMRVFNRIPGVVQGEPLFFDKRMFILWSDAEGIFITEFDFAKNTYRGLTR